MIKKFIMAIIVSLAVTFLATANTFAQDPCLLGVGNCPQNVDPGGGTRYYEGEIANQILTAKNYGSRYLVALQRYWDQNENCWAEERAWVGSVQAIGGGKVAVKMGPARKVLLKNQAMSVEQINNAEGWIEYSRKQIADWLKYKERVAPYLNYPYYQKWAQQQLQLSDAYIKQYENYINNTQPQIAKVAP